MRSDRDVAFNAVSFQQRPNTAPGRDRNSGRTNRGKSGRNKVTTDNTNTGRALNVVEASTYERVIGANPMYRAGLVSLALYARLYVHSFTRVMHDAYGGELYGKIHVPALRSGSHYITM